MGHSASMTVQSPIDAVMSVSINRVKRGFTLKEEIAFGPNEISSVSIICQNCNAEHLIPKPFPQDVDRLCWQCRKPLNADIAIPLLQSLRRFENAARTLKLRIEKPDAGSDSRR